MAMYRDPSYLPSVNRVLVCGGRDFADEAWLTRILDGLHRANPIDLIIHGGARGADSLAGRWASNRAVPVEVYRADWSAHGRAAGILRNKQMLEEDKPSLVVAFPGGRGTADMMRRAADAGVDWMRVSRAAQGIETAKPPRREAGVAREGESPVAERASPKMGNQMTQTLEPTEALSAAMIEAGSRVLCRAYEIDDGFSEEQADRHAASGMGLNFRKEARDCYLAMEAAREPEAGKLRDALEHDYDRLAERENAFLNALEQIAQHDIGEDLGTSECENCHDKGFEHYWAVKKIARTALSRNQGDGR